jgi:hypothetical protein
VRGVLAGTLASAASKDEIISKLGLCDPLPLYLQEGSHDLLVDEINMIVMYTCAVFQQLVLVQTCLTHLQLPP